MAASTPWSILVLIVSDSSNRILDRSRLDKRYEIESTSIANGALRRSTRNPAAPGPATLVVDVLSCSREFPSIKSSLFMMEGKKDVEARTCINPSVPTAKTTIYSNSMDSQPTKAAAGTRPMINPCPNALATSIGFRLARSIQTPAKSAKSSAGRCPAASRYPISFAPTCRVVTAIRGRAKLVIEEPRSEMVFPPQSLAKSELERASRKRPPSDALLIRNTLYRVVLLFSFCGQ